MNKTLGAQWRLRNEDVDLIKIAKTQAELQPYNMQDKKAPRVTTTTTLVTKTTTVRGSKRAVAVGKPPKMGSAAADWSRWPMGTTFRLLSTGQTYRIEDYGWAVSGRNTIDPDMSNQRDMNTCGARQEPIQNLHWDDARESLPLIQ